MMTIAKVGTPTTPSIGLLALLDNPEQVRQTIAEYETAKQAAIEEQNKAAQAVAQANALKAEMDKRDKAQAKREARISEGASALIAAQEQLAVDRQSVSDSIASLNIRELAIDDKEQYIRKTSANLAIWEGDLRSLEDKLKIREATVLAREQDVERRIAALKELIGA